MPFALNDFFVKLLSGWGIAVDAALAEAERIKGQFPDLAPRIDAFEAWLREKAGPALDPVKMAGTLRGVATDIMSGVSGVDPGAWRGSV